MTFTNPYRELGLRIGLLVVVASSGALSCTSDPVRSAEMAAAGDELPNVEPGEYHRAGQQCTACHRSNGPAPDFSIAGTIFFGPKIANGVKGVTVTLRDPSTTVRKTTNCVGNFFVTREEWNPKFPVQVTLSYEDGTTSYTTVMQTLIYREGSCAYCHKKPKATFRSVGHVALTLDEAAEKEYTAPPGCPAPTKAAGPNAGSATTASGTDAEQEEEQP